MPVPGLPLRLAEPDTDFNLSGSASPSRTPTSICPTASEMIAVWSGMRRAGADVECESPGVDYARLARAVFRQGEASAGERPAEFLRLWTAKEAYVKALGVGIARLHDVCVRCDTVQLTAEPRARGSLWRPAPRRPSCSAPPQVCIAVDI
jgi:4'-phosphopantetheinyl transferase